MTHATIVLVRLDLAVPPEVLVAAAAGDAV
jgi:hypothetical protein